MKETIDPGDILPYREYGRFRGEHNSRIIQIEKLRRISSKHFSFLFENRDTVINQINEMVYLEKITDESQIKELIDIYSDLLPGSDTLSVSMFIEFEDYDIMVRELKKLVGVEKYVYLTFDGHEIRGIPEENRSTESLEATLQYIKFRFDDNSARLFHNASIASIAVRHAIYGEEAIIPPDLLNSLKQEIHLSA